MCKILSTLCGIEAQTTKLQTDIFRWLSVSMSGMLFLEWLPGHTYEHAHDVTYSDVAYISFKKPSFKSSVHAIMQNGWIG